MGFARYRRETVGRSCEFCLVLASRGAVYESETSAGGTANRYHPACDCRPVLVTDFDSRYDTAIDPTDADRRVSVWNRPRAAGGRRYTYDLGRYRGRAINAPPPPRPVAPIRRTPRPTAPTAPAQTPGEAAAQAAESMRLLAGERLIVAQPGGSEFRFPRGWQSRTDDMRDAWTDGDALALVTAGDWHVIDIDFATGGVPSEARKLLERLGIPIGGEVATPGGGAHLYIPATGIRSSQTPGVDFRGGTADGQGLGLVYLPGTRRPKYEGGGYQWTVPLAKVQTPADYADRVDRALRLLGLTPHR